MAVSESDLVVGPLVPAAGVTTISLDFFFELAEWLEVYRSGSEAPLILNVDYTVAGAGSTNGVVTLATPANGIDAFSVYLVVPMERSSDMQLRGEFKSEPFNIEMDRLWQAMQGIRTRLARTFRTGRTAQVPAPLADPVPGSFLGLDANGDLVSLDPPIGSTPVSSFMAPVLLSSSAVSAREAIGIHGTLHPLNFGAVGDGVTDDSLAFAQVEGASGTTVDLGGRTYALTSFWTDPTNGVLLTKDYVNGRILMDGRPYVQHLQRGLAEAGAFLPQQVATRAPMGLFRRDENTYFVWSPLGGRYWAEMQVSRTGTGIPFNWRETFIRQRLGIIGARDGSSHTYTGGWSDTASGTFNLNTADPAAYITGVAKQAVAAGDYVEISYTGGGDLFVIFTGRTNGNFVNVLLNGGQEYLILPDDGAGNRFFDSYTATDLAHRQIVQIASGVPNGTHTIRLTVSASKNAASAGNRYIHNALAFLDPETGPWTPETDAPQWASGQAVLSRQVRQWQGRYYYADGNGTTGATPPTHTSGSVSDGGVTWVFRAASGYELPSHRFHAIGSQLEYAYEIRPDGAIAREDVGGQLHGNEVQTAIQWRVGRSAVSLPDRAWAVGDGVSIREAIDATHSQIGGGTTPVVSTVLVRDFKPGVVTIRHEHELLMDAQLGYFYPHMWPLLHYSSIGAKYGITEIWSPGDGWRKCADFYGVSGQGRNVGRTKDFVMAARGPCMQPDGSAGVPSSVPAPFRLNCALRIAPEGADSYQQAGLRSFAYKDMNTTGIDVSAGGFSSMTSKLYFERNSNANPQPYQAGDVIRCRADYFIALEPAG